MRQVNEDLRWRWGRIDFEKVVRVQYEQYGSSDKQKRPGVICANCGDDHEAETCPDEPCVLHLNVQRKKIGSIFNEK